MAVLMIIWWWVAASSTDKNEELASPLTINSALQVYPNPTDNKITVELGLANSSKVGIKLTDATGRIVFNETVSTNGLNFRHDIDMKTSQVVFICYWRMWKEKLR